MQHPLTGLSAEVILELSPEELAAILLQVLKKQTGLLHPQNIESLFTVNSAIPGNNGLPGGFRERADEIELVLSEAWAWMQAQCLIIPASGMNGRNGFVQLSRRAQAIASDLNPD